MYRAYMFLYKHYVMTVALCEITYIIYKHTVENNEYISHITIKTNGY